MRAKIRLFVKSSKERPVFLHSMMVVVINTELRRYVEQNIIPRYDGFDTAHRGDHVMMVIRQSMELAAN